MSKLNLMIFLLGIFLLTEIHAQPLKRLEISENGRYLQTSDDKPFFYLGDTAWELFHRLDREEADLYLQNRAEKGFTVIQAVVLAQLGGLTDPNPYDAIPLQEKDPTRPNEKYFEHVDYIVNKANQLGLYIGMLPTWGSYWLSGSNNKIFNPDNAQQFGEYLGKRYRESNVIWILGGDANIGNSSEKETIEAMARGLQKGDQGNHLITFHPRGPGRSSDYFHDADWLDFNMFQSSHAARNFDNGMFAAHDYNLNPPKPTIDGEPRYENILVGFYYRGNNQMDKFDAIDARTAAYWSLLSGAFGHTYGNNNIWQMYAPGRSAVINAQIPWFEAIDHPGAFNMGVLKDLFVSRPFHKLVPSEDFIVDGPGEQAAKVKGAIASDRSFAFVYSPQGGQFTVDLSMFEQQNINEYWYNPRYGEVNQIHSGGSAAIKTYTPPTEGYTQDWVLVIDQQKAGFDPPGLKNYFE